MYRDFRKFLELQGEIVLSDGGGRLIQFNLKVIQVGCVKLTKKVKCHDWMIKKATWMTKKRILIESNVTKDMMVIQESG